MADPITQTAIVDVALELLADRGLHALAMRRIAHELGVQQSALYWHFGSKQLLLAAVADRLAEGVVLAEDGEWVDRIEGLASSLRRELLRHPDGAELVATVFAFRLGARRPFELFVDVLTHSGLRLEDASVAASVLIHFVFGYATGEQQHDQAAVLGAIEPAPGEHGPTELDDRFVSGVRLIVGGIDTRLRTVERGSSSVGREA